MGDKYPKNGRQSKKNWETSTKKLGDTPKKLGDKHLKKGCLQVWRQPTFVRQNTILKILE